MTYIESETIVRGAKVGVLSRAAITAAISPIWFDCLVPGIFSALLRTSPSAIHIPAPALAFSFPFFMHDPSV